MTFFPAIASWYLAILTLFLRSVTISQNCKFISGKLGNCNFFLTILTFFFNKVTIPIDKVRIARKKSRNYSMAEIMGFHRVKYPCDTVGIFLVLNFLMLAIYQKNLFKLTNHTVYPPPWPLGLENFSISCQCGLWTECIFEYIPSWQCEANRTCLWVISFLSHWEALRISIWWSAVIRRREAGLAGADGWVMNAQIHRWLTAITHFISPAASTQASLQILDSWRRKDYKHKQAN